MAGVSSSRETLSLGEEWIAQVLDGTDVSDAQRQVLVRLDDRRVCLSVVAADDSEEAWSRYAAAAARRASVTGYRLRPLLASGRTDDCFYVAYDVGNAHPLADHGELPEVSSAQAVQLLSGVGRGLDQAAAKSFYPAELTPESVFVDPNRGAVLVDLGVAREALGNPPAVQDRRAHWVAPEVLRGGEAVERSMVYSFGALMYTLLTGAPPHDGAPDEIVAADAPSIRRLRPDLPKALDVVIATAMARDPRRRYPTVSETRNLANILLPGDLGPASTPPPAAQQQEPAPKPRRRSPQAATLKRRGPEVIAGPLAVRAPGGRVPSRLRRSRAYPVVLAGGALVAGALAGVLLAGPESEQPPAPHTFARGGLQVRLPGDWRETAPAAGALAAHPVDDPGSGLSLELITAPVEREEQGNPVRLGRLEAWRQPGVEVAGARAGVRYVVPTESGKLVATCRASVRAASGTLSTCERVASTLELRSARGLSLAAVGAQQERWQREVRRLGKQRAIARRKLALADRSAGQRLAAEALGRVHDRAAARFGALPGGQAVAETAERTASSYRALAVAADGESSPRWNAARALVRRNEDSLRRALADSWVAQTP